MLERRYAQEVLSLAEKASKEQADNIEVGAKKIADCLLSGGIVHAFGSGHSAVIAREITGRAGGVVPVNAVPEMIKDLDERNQEHGTSLIDRYAAKYGLNSGEVMIVISTSGRNPVPIEVALESKKRGLYVISITSLEYSRNVTSRHPSGKRLFEIADLVLDTGVPVGDAMVEVPGLVDKVGPGSTVVGALLINMLMIRAIEEVVSRGGTPPVLRSQNIDGADEYNQMLKEKYKDRLVW